MSTNTEEADVTRSRAYDIGHDIQSEECKIFPFLGNCIHRFAVAQLPGIFSLVARPVRLDSGTFGCNTGRLQPSIKEVQRTVKMLLRHIMA